MSICIEALYLSTYIIDSCTTEQTTSVIIYSKIMMSKSENAIKLPIFDMSQPLSPSSLSSLSLACKEWGFFHIINHGVPKDLYKTLCSLSRNHIFNLPAEVKLKAGPSSAVNTYTPHFIASPFFESLRVSGPDFFNSAQSSTQALLNQPNSEFW